MIASSPSTGLIQQSCCCLSVTSTLHLCWETSIFRLCILDSSWHTWLILGLQTRPQLLHGKRRHWASIACRQQATIIAEQETYMLQQVETVTYDCSLPGRACKPSNKGFYNDHAGHIAEWRCLLTATMQQSSWVASIFAGLAGVEFILNSTKLGSSQLSNSRETSTDMQYLAA